MKTTLTSKQIKENIVANLEECKYDKNKIIQILLTQDLKDINLSDDNRFLQSILFDGWKGYAQMTLAELKKEYNERFEEQI